VLQQFEGESAHLFLGEQAIADDPSGWRLWNRIQHQLPALSPLPFTVGPGWVGYVGFEMARQLERLPASRHEDLGLPLLRMALFDQGLVFDHQEERAYSVSAPGVRAALGKLGLGHASRANRREPRSNARTEPPMSRPAYERMVRRAIEYIAAGDIYQVNLAQRFTFDGVDDPLGLYAAVRRSNPAPYGALLKWDDGAVASFSPELFLQLRENRVLTCPIKGTRPRTGDQTLDDAYRRELLTSAKEAAELAMIVDLHRNDLGRVCRYGSVRVLHPRRIEAHPSVFHTVADIAGELAPGRGALDLLAACFPAGSISGVPKIRALEIIDELEPAARGVYTGAIGVLGLDGQMTFNVAIRTLQMRGTRATLYVGGGIVADSDPAAEYEETLAKAAGILRGVKAVSGEWRVASSE
jgi:para-aminobenzoate synthetase component 1